MSGPIFTKLTGVAAPLLRDNVDTDVIIRIDTLLRVPREELGKYCFEALRYRTDGTENPEFVLNTPRYRNAPILLAGSNFGCGSSREHAVWALQGMGFRCVIAPSFGDIFLNNCFQNAFLPVTMAPDRIEAIARESAEGPGDPLVTVDLESRTVLSPGGSATSFEIAERRREGLLEGLDEIGMTLKSQADIDAFLSRDHETRPWIYI